MVEKENSQISTEKSESFIEYAKRKQKEKATIETLEYKIVPEIPSIKPQLTTQTAKLQPITQKPESDVCNNDAFENSTSDSVGVTLAKIIEKDDKLSLNDIIQKSKYARKTVQIHLKHLVKEGLLEREAVINGRGRPTILYNRTKVPISSSNQSNVVTLSFGKLKRFCRLEKSGFCKERQKQCSFNNCPIVAPAGLIFSDT